MMMIDKDTGLMSKPSTPWHVWAVGIVAVLWNGFGAVDYVMTQMQHEEYMSSFSDEQKAFFYSLPIWAVIGWAVGIWSAVAGSILILLRSRFAETAFLMSLAGMAVSFGHNVTSGSMELMGGPVYLLMAGVIIIIGLALYYYARRMRVRGVFS